MLGRTHAVTGWCAGLATAPLFGLAGGPALVFAAATTGAALVPDIDERNSTVSRSLGWISRLMSTIVRGTSKGAFYATRASNDVSRRQGSGTHRYLTHTLIWACTTGLIAMLIPTAASHYGGPHAGAISVLVCGLLLVLLAATAVGAWALIAGLIGVAATLYTGELMMLNELTVHLGVAVGLGQITHIAGDWSTEAPVPALWPIPIRGRRWYPCTAPKFMRFKVGSPFERQHVFPAFALLGVMLLPHVPEVTAELLTLISAHFETGVSEDVNSRQVWLGAAIAWLALIGTGFARGDRARQRV